MTALRLSVLITILGLIRFERTDGISYTAQAVTLYADTTDLSAGYSPHLTCNHNYNPLVSWWLNGEIVLRSQVNGEECHNEPTHPDYLADCTCTNSAHTCTLKDLSWSNFGDRWACSIGTAQSNILTLTLPAPKSVTLYADTTAVSAVHSPLLTCHHDNYPIVSWWHNGEIVLRTKVNGRDCLNTPTNPDYLTDCTCSYTVHICTLRNLDRSNDGDQWACCINESDGTVIKSNILTLELPAPKSVNLSADTTDVSAGHSPHLTCHHDNYPIVSWWLNGVKALSAQVNGTDCLNTPTNPAYLADCTCTQTVHTCTLKNFNTSNVVDQWACSISDWDGTVIKSNILTLTLPAPKSVNLSADTTDVSAGHLPHLTCHHDNYPIVSWWLNGVRALSAHVNGTDCLNIPTNQAYLTDCTCTQTVHTCTLKNFNTSNVGDQWACSISDWDGTVIQSNILTLTLPAPQLVTLYADTTVVSAGHSIHMTCHHYNDPLVSWWLNGEIALSAQVNRGDCMNTPTNPDYLANCTCANTVHTCTLKHLSLPNVGDQWACSISDWNGTVIKSNILTLTLPAAHLVTLHTDTTDVSAGRSPHLTCHHDDYKIVSWWLNGEIALIAQENGGDCLNIPTNLDYLADCTCTNTVHKCTLKHLSRSNVGDQWACSIRASDGTVIKSNTLTLELPELPRGNSAVIAGSVGSAVGGLIIIVVVVVMVIILKRRKKDIRSGSDVSEVGSDYCVVGSRQNQNMC
ncbi:uncharacterized protein LOC127848161 isoform X3 [Dreissena polymorpha]|uniref:uncharacterized protein LOC127848161 isoform X3 n=1 Tax=Dreissena polymorpha TaxID=45954 RepID=UPI0022656C90|nr:uncharacterized protein LOC127848161 isoform X3 [Dreissena polymorpha]